MIVKITRFLLPTAFFLAAVFLSPLPGSAQLIQFKNFDWEMSLYGVELQAAEAGYRLEEKNTAPPDLSFKFSGEIFGEECEIEFNFTPLSQKLYSVRLEWEGSIQGNFIL